MTGKTVSFLFACSPESALSTRVFKLMSRDDLVDPATQIPDLLDFEDRVLDEDLVVLESYARMALRWTCEPRYILERTGSGWPIAGYWPTSWSKPCDY